MIGPIATILLSAALLDEQLTIPMIVGTGLVLGGVWAPARAAKDEQARATK